MSAIKASSKSCSLLRSARKSSGSLSTPLRPARIGARQVVVRAEEVDYAAKANEYANKAVTTVKTVWEDTADAEKPAIIAILAGVVVVQVAIGATMSVIDKLPFFGDFFELVGLAVIATYTYRYVSDPSERASAKETVDDFVNSVTGQQ